MGIRIGGGRQSQAKEPVLCIAGHGRRCAKAIKLDPARCTQGLHRFVQHVQVEAIADLQKRVDGRIKGLESVLGQRISVGNGDLAEARAGSELLRQRQFKVEKTVAADGPAKSNDGRLADLSLFRQVDNTQANNFFGARQDILGDLTLGASQRGQFGTNGFCQFRGLHAGAPVMAETDCK